MSRLADDAGRGIELRAVTAVVLGVLLAWQLLVWLTAVPAFILPAPLAVGRALLEQPRLLLANAAVTSAEIIAGLLLGTLLGIASAVLLVSVRSARRWALPLMVISQSLPVFALAPVLTLWFGYGIGSKIVMATLIIYFPVVAAAFDGLRHTPDAMLDLADTLGAGAFATLVHVRLPAALPSIASGVRVAASVAPIGAVVGEWVGASRGLGHLMLNANGRMQTDLMFAALACLAIVAVTVYALVDAALDRALYWQHDTATRSAPPSRSPSPSSAPTPTRP